MGRRKSSVMKIEIAVPRNIRAVVANMGLASLQINYPLGRVGL